MIDLLAWGASSALLILAVLLVRALAKSRLSCRARYALWLLVLVRLLVPAQFIEAPWGETRWELSMKAAAHRMVGARELARLELPTHGFDANGEPLFASEDERQQWEDFTSRPPEGVSRPAGMNTGASAEEAVAVWFDEGRPVGDIVYTVWLAGAGLMAAVLLFSNLRFARRLKRARKPFDETGAPRVYVAEDIPSPCLVGVVRPCVYLTPESARDERTLRHVLAHEETHRRHGDGVWSVLRLAALCLHWYDPLAWYAAVLSKRDGELACDEATLARLGEDERVSYGETLLSLVRGGAEARGLLSASTAMTAGKKTMRERIETIARHPRTRAIALLLAAAALLGATVCAFSKGVEARADSPEPAQADERRVYASAEEYVDSVRARMTTVTYYDATDTDSAGEKLADVLDTRVAFLEKRGELPGVAPDGTLELYAYLIETKLDKTPVTNAVVAGGMYVTEDGWCDFSGQGGRAAILLRRADGTLVMLHDQSCGDDMGGIWYNQNNETEALYDWAVQYYGLDLPLYAVDLIGSPISSTCIPAHRVDGDGWYFYLPVSAWYRSDDGDTARWFSQYNTGSMLSIKRLTSADECDLVPRAEHWDWTVDGRVKTLTYEDADAITTAYLYDASDGGCWQVLTQYYHKTGIHSDMRGLESEVLYAMARSFTADARFAKQDVVRWEADLNGDGAAERIVLDTRLLEGQAFALPWIESAAGKKLCELDPIGYPTAVWNTYALTELDGETYLMEYQPSRAAGEARYTCVLWTVSAQDGRLWQRSVKRVTFPVGEEPLDEETRAQAAVFADEMNALWAKSRLLFTTDEEVMAHLYDAATGETVEADAPHYCAGAGRTVRYRETMRGMLDE